MLGGAVKKTIMRRFLSIVIIISGSIIIASCGYTVIQKNQVTDKRPSPLPDLAIIDITARQDDMIMIDDPDDRPTWSFRLTITNVGYSTFDNNAVIAWSEGSENIAWGDYSNHSSMARRIIAPGDTVMTEISARHCGYVSGQYLRFVIATKSIIYPCKTVFAGAPSVEESDYRNNFYDFVIP